MSYICDESIPRPLHRNQSTGCSRQPRKSKEGNKCELRYNPFTPWQYKAIIINVKPLLPFNKRGEGREFGLKKAVKETKAIYESAWHSQGPSL